MPKILNFGSLNIDYVYTVNHFVRPGETLPSISRDIYCGGKGLNQSIALARAGAETYHAGAVGSDGGILIDLLKNNNVDISFIQKRECASGHAIIQRDLNGQNCILLYGGSNQSIIESDIDSTLSCFNPGDYLVLQNEINSIKEIIQKGKSRGMKIVLNPSPIDEKLQSLPLDLVDILVLNEVEAMEISGESSKSNMLNALSNRFPHMAITLTLGKDGVQYKEPSLTVPLFHGIYNVEVVDTTAAGDTFTGYFITCISKGMPIAEALRIASIASSIAVSRHGAAPSIPSLNEVLSSKLKFK